MNSSDNFCIRQNDFKENLIGAFQELWKSNDFTNVTLIGGDNQKILAHKDILAAFSPIFRDILKEYEHPHPFIYMRGIKAKQLTYIVNFLYFGEVNLHQEDLSDFLTIAEELQIKGMNKKSEIT